MKNLKAPEAEIFAKGYEKSNILSEIWEIKGPTWMNTRAQKFGILIAKMKKFIGGVATTHFVMQNSSLCRKKSIWIRNMDSMFF